MSLLNFSAIGDSGSYRSNGTSFYYQPGGAYEEREVTNKNNKNIISIGPALSAVGKLVQGFNNTEILAMGDQAYTTGASTLYDESNGRVYNNFMAPYPSPRFTSSPYRQETGDLVWPFDTYNYPTGYPNPVDGGVGGSADKVNRFWPANGNHDYALRIGYGEINVSSVDKDGKSTVATGTTPAGNTSTPVLQPYLDYFGWLADPSLLTNQSNVKVGRADASGNEGVYFSVTLGQQENGNPLMEVFSIDTTRIVLNSNSYSELTEGLGNQGETSNGVKYNYLYDPTNPNANAAYTSKPENGNTQYSWLYNGIKNSSAKWKIIMGHHPIYGSGEWGDANPDNHISNPGLQKMLDGLTTTQLDGQPGVQFDAYLNGHAHFYQRVLEGNSNGIGQGIPFITIGNSGRTVDAINVTKYGDNVYQPDTPGMSLGYFTGQDPLNKNSLKTNPQGDITPYLLQSRPTTVGVSGGYYATNTGKFDGDRTGFTPGAYGYGFGALDNQADDSYLFFNYKQTDVFDPAIDENLSVASRNKALSGWDGLKSTDWKPALATGTSSSDALLATAQLEITIATDGTIKGVSLKNGGKGYMSSKGGNHTVDFEIRGNDSYTQGQAVNPNNYAIATLTFAGGVLSNAALKSKGEGYTFLGQANANLSGVLKTEETDLIPINHSLLESWYGQPYTDYKDWYLITDTSAASTTGLGSFGSLSISILPKSQAARDLISNSAITTGYNGSGQQQKYDRAQAGDITVKDPLTGQIIGMGSLSNGVANLKLSALATTERIKIDFAGDPTSSYQTDFNSSSTESATNFIYRSVDPLTGTHLYTDSLSENSKAISGAGYRYEQVGMLNKGNSPIYRFYNPITTDHLYTINSGEKDSLLKNPSGYSFEGIAFYGEQVSGASSTPVQRLYNPTYGLHFYTASVAEATSATTSGGYKLEGVGWYF
jgi:hypothetical protein